MAPGEAGGFVARADGCSCLGYVKPTNRSPDNHPRAANEKIVSDLARAVGICVPPVQLYRRDKNTEGHETRACVSMVMYPQFHEWERIVQLGDAAVALARSALARACGIIAFDAYVGNTDRANARNSLFGSDPASPIDDQFVFVDFANSLLHHNHWTTSLATKHVVVPNMFDAIKACAHGPTLSQTIQAIEELTDETIDGILARIPEDYMSSPQRELVREGLKVRRALVRPVLATQFNLN